MAFLKHVQEYMQYIAATATACLYTATVYPQVWGITKYQQFVQHYTDGVPTKVDADSQRIGQEILDKLLWDVRSESNVTFFTVYGQDLVNKGSASTRRGALIGIPVSFRYRNISHVEKSKITLLNHAIEWDSPAGQQLLQSMVLSEPARRFGIARELMYVNSQHVHLRAILLASFCFVSYWAGFAINRMYRLPQRAPMPFRLMVYTCFGSIGMTGYLLASDKYNWYRDRKADRKAAELGKEFAEGGVEFYDQMLRRNMALRALMGSDGPKKYTVYGNDVHFWRSPQVPLSARKDAVTKILQSKYSAKVEKTQVDNAS